MLYPKAALDAIVALGYTARQAEFLWIAATFSGHFLVRHYERFAGIERGKSTATFIAKALGLGHVREYEYTAQAPRYHLFSRPFYTTIGQANNNHRRGRSLTQVNQKLAQLDFVIDHQDYAFLPDEPGRLAHFSGLGVDHSLLPARTYPATTPGLASLTHYFVDKFPLATQPRLLFSYVDEYSLSLPSFETHLRQYLPLFRALKPPVSFVFLSPVASRFVDAEHMFSNAIAGSAATSGAGLEPELDRYFRIKRAVEKEEWAQLGKQDYVDKPELAKRYESPENAALYRSWLAGVLPRRVTPSAGPLDMHFEVYVPPSLPTPREYSGGAR